MQASENGGWVGLLSAEEEREVRTTDLRSLRELWPGGRREARGQQSRAGQGAGEGSNWQSGFPAVNFQLDPVVHRHSRPALRKEKGWEPLAKGTPGVFGTRGTTALDNRRPTLGAGKQLTWERPRTSKAVPTLFPCPTPHRSAVRL